MTMNDSNPSKPKRRWYQFSLRRLLLFVLLLCLPLSWLAFRLEQTWRDKAVLAHFAEYDYNAYWRYSSLMEKEANETPFGYVFDLRIWGNERSAPEDDDLDHLTGLSGLESLTISYSPGVTDAGLVHLGKLTKLESLRLNGCTNVGDDGLKHLKKLSRLKRLIVSETSVTNEGVERLQRALPHCEITR